MVAPNTGAPGESRSRGRRVGPLGGSTGARPPVDGPAGNGHDALDAATQRAPYRNGVPHNGVPHNGVPRNGVPRGGVPRGGGTGHNGGAPTGRHAVPVDRHPDGPPPVEPDPPTTRAPYRGPGRQPRNLGPPYPGYLVDAPTYRYASGSSPHPGEHPNGGPRNGASIGRRTLSSAAAARLAADPAAPTTAARLTAAPTAATRLTADPSAPTEFIRRGAHSDLVRAPHAPGRRPSAPIPGPTAPPDPMRRPVPGTGRGRPVGLTPSAPERGRQTGGRRHHREGSRPASEFANTAPGRKKLKGGRRRRGSFWKELPILVVVALVLTCLIQTFLARVYEIPSGSMMTTLYGCPGCQNDRVLVDKLSYHFGEPAPGDVVVFAGPSNWQDSDFRAQRSDNALIRGLQSIGSLVGLAPPDEKDLIKRVIAVGGQTVACCDSRNRVTVNGKPLDELSYVYYLPEAGPPVQAEFGPYRVPDGQLWVMGDSRNNSADSRVPGHGPIPVDAVIGKARFVVLPFRRAQTIPDPNPQVTTPPQAAR